MENSKREGIVQELSHIAPELARIRQSLPNPIPFGYEESLAENTREEVLLALWQSDHTHDRENPEYPGQKNVEKPQVYLGLMSEKLLSGILQETENYSAEQHKTTSAIANTIQSFAKRMTHTWVYAAACILLGISTMTSRFLLQDKMERTRTEQLTVDESLAFLEANIDEMAVEELIEWDVLEQEDLEIQYSTLQISDNDSL